MTPLDWQRIKTISAAALDQPEAERLAYVFTACQGDEALTREVRSLLVSAMKASTLFETPSFASPAAAAVLARMTGTNSTREGDRIGPYRIVREIGRGGMGSVFLAERADDEYRQQVAVKVAVEARSSSALRWLREERQMLAGLDHPNIARLMDGGTTDEGVPYLVMEYVEGIPVDAYCSERQLGTRARLTLFKQICSAVDVAHRNLIVHRDLKPQNILVADGVPKLLDFGIAKLLDSTSNSEPRATGSHTGPRMLTPEYASPEQLKGGPITTATDVYALGVLLYRLLTDRTPYRVQSDAPHELATAICDQEVERPSLVVTSRSLRRQLAGDLDTIALKALKKDPADRYASVAALADDIDRHLAALPVNARRDTLGYRAAKFFRRHRMGAAAAALVLLVLIGGLFATLWQAREAERQRARAQRHFDDVRRLASSLIFEVHDGIEDLPGSTATRQLLVKRALDYFDGLAAEEYDNPALQSELAAAYDRLAGVLGRPYASNLGDSRAALASYRKALSIREALARQSLDRQTQLDLSSSYLSVGTLLVQTADTRGGLPFQQKSSEILERLLAATPDDPALMRTAARTFVTQAHAFEQLGSITDALAVSRRALAMEEGILARDPSNNALRSELATSHGRVGIALLRLGDVPGSLSHLRQRSALAERLIAAAPGNVPFRRGRSTAHLQLGQALLRSGDLEGAKREMNASLALRRSIADQDPSDRQAAIDVMFARLEFGQALSGAGNHTAAIEQFRPALRTAEMLAAADPDYVFYRISGAALLTRLSQSLVAVGNIAEASPLAERAVRLMETAAAADATDIRVRFEMALAYEALGDVASARGNSPQSPYKRSVEILSDLRDTGRLAGGTLIGGEVARLAAIERKLALSR